jgi:phosphoglycolate phosphatase
MKFKAVLFDLDGTLIDSLTDIANACNNALQSVGRPAHPVNAYRYMVGQGLEKLMVDALGPDHQHLIPQCSIKHMEFYQKDLQKHTIPYPGIEKMLDALTARNVTLAILSNKPHAAMDEIVSKQLGNWKFARVYGHREGWQVKPDPGAAVEITRELDIPASQWLYVGDTRVDMLTGAGAGMLPVGVLWGFRDEPELRASGAKAIIKEPMELLGLLGA